MGRSSRRKHSQGFGRVMASGGGAAAAALPRPMGPLWILNSWQDLLLFIATPILIIPALMLAQLQLTDEQIYRAVIMFGASGHHFPGLLRAYGDRELFARYKLRFILSPIFLVGFCMACAQWSPTTLSVLVLGWGFWHGLMQVYGFMRIYDAKAGSFDKVTARLDWAFCLTFFVLGLLMSPVRFGSLLDNLYRAGFPVVPVSVVHAIQDGWLALTIVVGVLFTWNMIRQWQRGTPVSPVKLLTIALSFGFWWYSQVHVQSLFLGIAMFELFHDVQYLGIVWFFNRKRVDTVPNVGTITRFLFRPGFVLMAVYVVLCLSYGGLVGLGVYAGQTTQMAALFGLGPASGFLHYYFDGFIWKVREKSTRAGLGIQGGGAEVESFPKWIAHGSKWLLFVIPAVLFWVAGATQPRTVMEDYFGLPEDRYQKPVDENAWKIELARYESLAEAFPTVAKYQTNYGLMLKNARDYRGALEALSAALALEPDSPDAHLDLADVLYSVGKPREAEDQWYRALKLDPACADRVYLRLGWAANEAKNYAEAEKRLKQSLDANPAYAESHYEMARTLAATNRIDEAIAHLERALALKRRFPEATRLLEELRSKSKSTASGAQSFR